MSAGLILLLNGPNLGRLGVRQPEHYGYHTLADVEGLVKKVVEPRGFTLLAIQSNAESQLIDVLEEHSDACGAVINPGALMMYGWSLRDALEDFSGIWVEVHITNIFARESFRHKSVLAPIADGIVVGFGVAGYALAAQALIDQLAERSRRPLNADRQCDLSR